MKTKTPSAQLPAGYDALQFPTFAVIVDIVIPTMVERSFNAMLVLGGQEPFEAMWAISGNGGPR